MKTYYITFRDVQDNLWRIIEVSANNKKEAKEKAIDYFFWDVSIDVETEEEFDNYLFDGIEDYTEEVK